VKRETKAAPDRRDRLLAAALAPAAFNVCILIVLMVYLRLHGTLALMDFIPSALGIGLAIVFVVVPAAVGYSVGTDRFVTFLGHSFYTHDEDEREMGITIAIWAAIIFLAWLLSLALYR
jgi:hypothetical protein